MHKEAFASRKLETTSGLPGPPWFSGSPGANRSIAGRVGSVWHVVILVMLVQVKIRRRQIEIRSTMFRVTFLRRRS